jgi:glutaconate CoA-transferase subunit B
VPKVDFISAPGVSDENVHRTGGPYALVTGRCVFDFDADKRRFRLAYVHPGHDAEEIREHTGFDYDVPDVVPETPTPDAATLDLMRGQVADEVAETYPSFAARVFGTADAA